MLYKNWRKMRRRLKKESAQREREREALEAENERLRDLNESLEAMLAARLGVPVETVGAGDSLPPGVITLDEHIHESGMKAIWLGQQLLDSLEEEGNGK